jgi:hypothetical protein
LRASNCGFARYSTLTVTTEVPTSAIAVAVVTVFQSISGPNSARLELAGPTSLAGHTNGIAFLILDGRVRKPRPLQPDPPNVQRRRREPCCTAALTQ